MRGKIFGSVLGLGLMLAGPAQLALGAGQASAEEWHGRGGYGGGYYHHDHDGIGAGGVILGLAAVAGVAALASSASHHDGYYDRGYYAPPPPPAYGYGYAPGYYQGGYGNAAVSYCTSAAVGQARGWDGYARQGRVYSVDRRGDDVWVRGSIVSGSGYGGYGREIGFQCKFDNGRVRSLHIERPGYAYGY